jgi:hypothetical protein
MEELLDALEHSLQALPLPSAPVYGGALIAGGVTMGPTHREHLDEAAAGSKSKTC